MQRTYARSCFNRAFLTLIVSFLSVSLSAYADSTQQSVSVAPPPSPPSDTSTLSLVSAPHPVQIVDVNVLCEGRGDSAWTGDFVEVVVTGLPSRSAPQLDSVHARLVLNDLAQELPLMDRYTSADTTTFVFRLMPKVEGSPGWEGFIESIGINTEEVTVGLIVDGTYLGKYSGPIYFKLINTLWGIISLAITIGIVILLCWLGGKTMLFTDRILVVDAASASPTVVRGDFSLSRIQIAFWTVLVVAGFIYIWLSTGYAPDLPQSVLILMGISGATKVITGAMDAKQPLTAPPPPLPLGPKKGIGKVLSDIISDDVSPTISRIQFVIWTLLFGGVFLEHIFEYVKFHDFTPEQLALMGISNGVYLLMRPNEQ